MHVIVWKTNFNTIVLSLSLEFKSLFVPREVRPQADEVGSIPCPAKLLRAKWGLRLLHQLLHQLQIYLPFNVARQLL